VTGCNTGLGQGMAVALAQAGCDIVGVSIKPADLTATAVQGMGRRFRNIATDLSAAVAEEVVARATAAFGRIDILVNNAGIIRRANALEFERDWDHVIAVNLKAVFFLSQAAARQFIRQQTAGEMTGGRIVNIASLLSFQGGIRVASYTAAKSGVLGLTRLLANEWAKYGITVNAIAPGYMETDNTAPLRADTLAARRFSPAFLWDAGGCLRTLQDRWFFWRRTPRPMSPATPSPWTGVGSHVEATVHSGSLAAWGAEAAGCRGAGAARSGRSRPRRASTW
jgi:2-dehydro-3-deoxy-D-gluconate 5-dehydrogenase